MKKIQYIKYKMHFLLQNAKVLYDMQGGFQMFDEGKMFKPIGVYFLYMKRS